MSFSKIKTLFDELAPLTSEARAERLALADIGAETKVALQRLMDLDDSMADDLERIWTERHESVPPQIGPFTVDGLMGEGGMGRVFRAHRDVSGVRQALAIKLVRRDRLDAATRARFQLESQILAVLKHPNIASMVDVGETSDGQPYLALEYIEGRHITDFAAEERLDLISRVKLFRDVASAVAYAHRNLIVHRDLKPSNVLVDSNGIAKVIDFGIAKPLMSQFGGSEVGETQTAQRFFSPNSAAPEQLQGGLVTPSCDVYGLGALLYELLTHEPVFDLRGLTGIAIEKQILNEEPKSPSSRIALSGQAGLNSDADLDAIVLFCLRKNPEFRYSSVEKLIEDIDAWLDGRPVVARNGNSWYRIRRFVARHRRGLLVACVILAIMVTAAGMTRQAFLKSDAQAIRADHFAQLLIKSLQAADPGAGNAKDLRIRDFFGQMAKTIEEDATLAAGDRVDLQMAIAQVLQRTGNVETARDTMARMVPPPVSEGAKRAKFYQLYGAIVRNLGEYAEADKLLQTAAETATGDLLLSIKFENARVVMDQGLDDRARAFMTELEGMKLSPKLTTEWLFMKADMLAGRSETVAESIPIYLEAIAQLKERGNETVATRLLAHETLVNLHVYLNDLPGAERQLGEINQLVADYYEPDSLAAARAKGSAANLAYLKRDLQQAVSLQRASIAGLEKVLPGTAAVIVRSYDALGVYEAELGNREAAHAAFSKAVAVGDKIWSPSHVNRFYLRTNFAYLLVESGRFGEARTMVEEVVALAASGNSDIHPEEIALGQFLVQAGDLDSPSRASHKKGVGEAFNRLAAQASLDSVRRVLIRIRPALIARGVDANALQLAPSD